MNQPNRLFRRLLYVLMIAATPALVLALESAPDPEFEAACSERLPAPSLQVRRMENGYRIDTKLSYQALTDMGTGLLRHGKKNILGITRAETTATVEIEMARLETDNGHECLSPQIVVTLEYKPITVYIGKEFAPGTCAYREIVLHEMRHVEAYRNRLPLMEAAVRTKLNQRFKGQILYGEQGRQEDALKAEISARWLPVVDEEFRKLDAAQAEIDSAEEYNRMEKVCDGEVQHVIDTGS